MATRPVSRSHVSRERDVEALLLGLAEGDGAARAPPAHPPPSWWPRLRWRCRPRRRRRRRRTGRGRRRRRSPRRWRRSGRSGATTTTQPVLGSGSGVLGIIVDTLLCDGVRRVVPEVGGDDRGVVQHVDRWRPSAMTAPWSMATRRSATDRSERHVVLDHDEGGAGRVADPAQERGRAPRSRAGRCRSTARRGGSPTGGGRGGRPGRRCGGCRSTARGRSSAGNGRRPSSSSSSSTRARPRPARRRRRSGRCRAAESGSRVVTQRSQATAIASVTVIDGKSRASWNERPRPVPAPVEPATRR